MSEFDLGRVLKGLYSAAVAVLGSLATVLSGDTTFGDITDGQWAAIMLAAMCALGGTFGLAGWSGPVLNGTRRNGAN